MTYPLWSRNTRKPRYHLSISLAVPPGHTCHSLDDLQGCTMRSRIFERLNVCCFCMRNVSETSGSPPTVLLCVGSGHGIPSLLVKYGPSSSRLPPLVRPEILEAITAGPSFALWKRDVFCIGLGSAPAEPTISVAV